MQSEIKRLHFQTAIAIRILSISLMLSPCFGSLVCADELDGLGELEPGFKRIFNGKTLAGWEGNDELFRVEDGAIVAGWLDKPIPNNEFLCTERKYSDFELRLEAKLIGEGNNAGIQFRTRRIPNHHEVSGYQCDMGSAWQRSIWGGLYDESRRKKMLAEAPKDQIAKWTKVDEWNEFRIRAEGPRIQIFLNGKQTVDYTESDDSIDPDGIIAVQIHGGEPAEASYRNIRIKELNKQ